MQPALRTARWLVARLSIVLVGVALVDRARSFVARRRAQQANRRRAARTVLPSLYDRHPRATREPQRRIGLRSVPLDRIVGTTRSPSQNTADFLPLPRLRGENWRGRWQRITRAMDRLAVLPPVDLVQVGDDYYVADGHNRVAAALKAGAVEIDADVTQLVVPGVTPASETTTRGSSLVGADELRRAGTGRHSRTVVQRAREDLVTRRDLVREPGEEVERS